MLLMKPYRNLINAYVPLVTIFTLYRSQANINFFEKVLIRKYSISSSLPADPIKELSMNEIIRMMKYLSSLEGNDWNQVHLSKLCNDKTFITQYETSIGKLLYIHCIGTVIQRVLMFIQKS